MWLWRLRSRAFGGREELAENLMKVQAPQTPMHQVCSVCDIHQEVNMYASYYYQLLTITIIPSPGTCIPECRVQQTVVQWRDRTVRGESLRLSCASPV